MVAKNSPRVGDRHRSTDSRSPSSPSSGKNQKFVGVSVGGKTGGAAAFNNETVTKFIDDGQNNENNNGAAARFLVYKWRWYVLAVVAALNCSNALSWIAYAAVANHVDVFYARAETANALTLSFLICAVPVGLAAMWLAEKFGIRTAILLGACFNCVGSLIRLVSGFHSLVSSASLRHVLVIGGQALAACAYPFVMFLPTKLASSWFPAHQRSLANSLATLANPLGVLLAMLLAPKLVEKPADLVLLNLLIAIFCTLTCLAAFSGVRASAPPTPPTAGAAHQQNRTVDRMALCKDLRKLFKSKSFMILLISLGSGIGMFNSLYGMMQQLLCARNYSNDFAGLCCVLMILGGFLGAFSSAYLVDKTKKFVQIMKIAFLLAVLAGSIFSICAMRPNLAVAIGLSCFVFGFFGLAAYPIGLEMAVECSFPVSETTSAGIIVLGGQILSTIYMLGMKMLRSPLKPANSNETLLEQCSASVSSSTTSLKLDEWGTSSPASSSTLTPPTTSVNQSEIIVQFAAQPIGEVVNAYDMTWPMAVFCGSAGLIVLFFVIFFKPKLRRLRLEQLQKQQETATLHKRAMDKDAARELIDLSTVKK